MGTNTETPNWTVCRVREPETLSPKWNAFIISLFQDSGSYVEEERQKIEVARGDERQNSSVLLIEQNSCTYELTEPEAACTGLVQV